MLWNETYLTAFAGLWLVLATWVVQWAIAAFYRASQPDHIPGKINPDLGHSSFAFRAHRVFMNSLENLPLMLGISFLAILVGVDPLWTAALIWAYALARIGYSILYYALATDRNPSPRSYLFLMGWLLQITLLVLCLMMLWQYNMPAV
ncbi:MAG: MAPEG family protein [Gammaproteobacteria bacterium]